MPQNWKYTRNPKPKGDYGVNPVNAALLDAILNGSIMPPIRASVHYPRQSFATGGVITGRYRMSSKGIQSSGMHGFSEEGAPDGWDMGIGEVYGYRWWKMAVPAELDGYTDVPADNYRPFQGGYPLTGANGCNWGSGRLEAKCPQNSAYSSTFRWMVHEPPEYRVSCGCGFWAYFDSCMPVSTVFSGLDTKNPYRVGSTAYLPVLGVVKGTGRVIIGTKGFRSQYAQIMGLCLPEVAKTQLHWDLQPRNAEAAHGWRAGMSDIFRALRSTPSYHPWYEDSIREDMVIRAAPENERLGRYAATEAMLSVAYPDAKILCDEDALRKYFGTDKNYGPGSRFQRDNEYGQEC